MREVYGGSGGWWDCETVRGCGGNGLMVMVKVVVVVGGWWKEGNDDRTGGGCQLPFLTLSSHAFN